MSFLCRLRQLALLGGLTLAVVACGQAQPTGRHGGTATPTLPPTVEYVAMGASDALGYGLPQAERTTQGYVPLLISRLPASAGALNLGIAGNTLHGALSSELPQAIAAHPTIVTVWLVANDFRTCTSLQLYLSDFSALLDSLKQRTHAAVFVANLPDMSALPAMRPGSQGLGDCHQTETQAQLRQETQSWNNQIAAIVASHGDTVVDLFSSELSRRADFISSDGFHPTALGYARLADLFWSAMRAHNAVPTQ